MTALEAVAANSGARSSSTRARTSTGSRWAGDGAPGSVPVTFVLPGKQHDPLPRPETKPVAARVLVALHEAGRTSSREDGRFALSRVQVLGATGRIVATDGKIAVMFDGFTFPFTGDVLVPAIPLFGTPEVRDETDVQVGRTDSHLVVSPGDWTVWLGVAPAGKFPDVAAVVPRHAPTTVALDRGDAAGLLPQLPGLPGLSHDLRPVTLCADGILAVRAGDDTGAVKEVVLARSPVTGPAARVALDRRALARILALRCTALRVTPGKALVGTGDGVTVLAALLDPELAVAPFARAPGPDADVPIPDLRPDPDTNPNPKRNTAVKPHETNGHPPGGRHDPPAETPDPLVAAEELRGPGRRRGEGRPAGGRAEGVEEGAEGAGDRAHQPEAAEPGSRRPAMTALVTQRVHRLADSLAELKVKVRAALATELAGAVGGAVRDVLIAALIDRVLVEAPRSSTRPPTPRPAGGGRTGTRTGTAGASPATRGPTPTTTTPATARPRGTGATRATNRRPRCRRPRRSRSG